MESNAGDARATLDALAADRARLIDRIRSPWWFYPGLGLAVTLIIASFSALGQPTQGGLVAIGAVLVSLVTLAHRRETGVTMNRAAGPRSAALLTVLWIVCGVLLVDALLLATLVAPLWSLLPAIAAFVVFFVLGLLIDRATAADLRDAR